MTNWLCAPCSLAVMRAAKIEVCTKTTTTAWAWREYPDKYPGWQALFLATLVCEAADAPIYAVRTYGTIMPMRAVTTIGGTPVCGVHIESQGRVRSDRVRTAWDPAEPQDRVE